MSLSAGTLPKCAKPPSTRWHTQRHLPRQQTMLNFYMLRPHTIHSLLVATPSFRKALAKLEHELARPWAQCSCVTSRAHGVSNSSSPCQRGRRQNKTSLMITLSTPPNDKLQSALTTTIANKSTDPHLIQTKFIDGDA
eukprot:2825386-Amphidinium_carterae.1